MFLTNSPSWTQFYINLHQLKSTSNSYKHGLFEHYAIMDLDCHIMHSLWQKLVLIQTLINCLSRTFMLDSISTPSRIASNNLFYLITKLPHNIYQTLPTTPMQNSPIIFTCTTYIPLVSVLLHYSSLAMPKQVQSIISLRFFFGHSYSPPFFTQKISWNYHILPKL